MKKINKFLGVSFLPTIFNALQAPIYIGFASLISHYLYGANQLNGFLWIQNLGLPDPYGIFPLCSAILSTLIMMNSSLKPQNNMMRGMKKYIPLMPCLLLPLWFAMPAALNIAWVVSSTIHFGVVLYANSDYHKRKVKAEMALSSKLLSKVL